MISRPIGRSRVTLRSRHLPILAVGPEKIGDALFGVNFINEKLTADMDLNTGKFTEAVNTVILLLRVTRFLVPLQSRRAEWMCRSR